MDTASDHVGIGFPFYIGYFSHSCSQKLTKATEGDFILAQVHHEGKGVVVGSSPTVGNYSRDSLYLTECEKETS